MKRMAALLGATMSVVTSGVLLADTLELYDGRLLEGDFIGSSNGIIMFDTGDGIEAFPQDKVVGLFFSDGVATAEAYLEKGDDDNVVVPAGTRLVVRTSDDVDSSRHSPGHRFTGQLEGALVVDGVTAVSRGAVIHGRLIEASDSGRMSGSAELAAVFTDILIDDQLISISTDSMSAQSGDEGATTAGRTARAAAVGGLMGGRDGLRRGARVGLGASILSSGETINIPRGTMVETTLTEPLTVSVR